MKPLRLRIRKKTKVPTKPGSIHSYRYDWKLRGVVDYSISLQLFNKLKTDAGFAKWLRDSYGTGTYSVIAWKKGREGFYSFLKIHCGADYFERLKKTKSPEQKKLEKKRRKAKELKKQAGQFEEVAEELEELEEDMSFDQEIIALDVNVKHGPYPYLKSTLPVYRRHGYSSEGYEEKQEEEQFQSLW